MIKKLIGPIKIHIHRYLIYYYHKYDLEQIQRIS